METIPKDAVHGVSASNMGFANLKAKIVHGPPAYLVKVVSNRQAKEDWEVHTLCLHCLVNYRAGYTHAHNLYFAAGVGRSKVGASRPARCLIDMLRYLERERHSHMTKHDSVNVASHEKYREHVSLSPVKDGVQDHRDSATVLSSPSCMHQPNRWTRARVSRGHLIHFRNP